MPVFHLPPAAEIGWLQMPDGAAVRTLRLPHEEPLANLLVLTGRADFLEKWADVFAILHDAGFAIISCDWRGQGGSHRLVDNGAGYIDSFDSWIADLSVLAEWAARALPDAPWLTLAHSMGGHILLRWLLDGHWQQGALGADLRGAIFSAPLVDVHEPSGLRRLIPYVARWHVQHGRGQDFAWGQTPYGLAQQNGTRQKLLTSSLIHFEDEALWLTERPELATGGVSWGWLSAFAESQNKLLQADPAKLDLPVLTLLAEHEQVVDNVATRRRVGRLPRARCIVVPGAAHEILRESDRIRAQAFRYITQFAQELLHHD